MSKKKLPTEAYYSIMVFLSSAMIECIDQLQGTNQYKKELKMYLNKSLKELERVNKEFYDRFLHHDKMTYKSLPEDEIPMLDIYNTISKSYDYAIEFFTTTTSNEMPMLMDILKKLKETDLSKYQMEIDPIKR